MKIYICTLLFLSTLIFTTACDELGSKSEYAALQQIEFENRHKNVDNTTIVIKDNYTFVGFKSKDGNANVWVLLNSKHQPYYKQMPTTDFNVTISDINKIKKLDDITKDVIDQLVLHIRI